MPARRRLQLRQLLWACGLPLGILLLAVQFWGVTWDEMAAIGGGGLLFLGAGMVIAAVVLMLRVLLAKLVGRRRPD